jgi:mRNA interferase MazF
VRRGDIYLANLDPAMGSEANKTRPVVIVSNDTVNSACERHGRGVVTVVPVTSNTERIYSFQILLPAGTAGLNRDSKAQAEQVRTIDVTRLSKRRLGAVPGSMLVRLDAALRLHLAL